MIIVDCDQNTEEWKLARMGKPTASQFSRIVTAKGTPSKSREKYLYELAGELVSGQPKVGHYNEKMKLGHAREEEARRYYQLVNNTQVDIVGFCLDDSELFGCSPDGLIGENGGYEGKNKDPHIQAELLDKGWSGSEYHRQVMGCLLVTGREWWDLQAYSRGMKPVVVRFERDEEFLSMLRCELESFCSDLKKLVERISQ